MGRPKILIISKKGRDQAQCAGADMRAKSMAKDLAAGGFQPGHALVSAPREFENVLALYAPDIIFSNFFRFEDGGLDQRYLRDIAIRSGIAWIGSSSEVMERALSKPSMKSLWRQAGISTPDWFTVEKGADGSLRGLERIESARDFPYIVKPANEGNSRGIDDASIVKTPMELYSRSSMVAEVYGEAIIERFVAGGPDSREFTVAMIGNGSKALIAPAEIIKEKALVVSEEDKSGSAAVAALPIEDERMRNRVRSLAQRIFLIAGIRDYARCDLLYHEETLYGIEVNGQPMIPDPWFEACARGAGLDEAQYVNAIALAGIVGNAQTGHAYIPEPRELKKLLPQSVFERLSPQGGLHE
jgi:D-alanine-D-alanine ligase